MPSAYGRLGRDGSVMKFQARNLPDQILQNLRRSLKLAARGPKSSRPLVLPLMIEIPMSLTASTRACATWWLTRFDWLSRNGAQSHRHKGTKQKAMSGPPDPAATAAGTAAAQQELWQFRKSSRDNRWLAIPSPSDLRHKKCHIYH
jgi:capsular polysaccharide biosynthesis protein